MHSPKYSRAREFLHTRNFDLLFSQQNIMESVRILTHPKLKIGLEASHAVKKVLKITSLGAVLAPQLKTHLLACEIIEKYKLKSNLVFDAYLLATALDNNIKTIATDNERYFKKFEEVIIYNPFNL